jgi:hypothetical protein
MAINRGLLASQQPPPDPDWWKRRGLLQLPDVTDTRGYSPLMGGAQLPPRGPDQQSIYPTPSFLQKAWGQVAATPSRIRDFATGAWNRFGPWTMEAAEGLTPGEPIFPPGELERIREYSEARVPQTPAGQAGGLFGQIAPEFSLVGDAAAAARVPGLLDEGRVGAAALEGLGALPFIPPFAAGLKKVQDADAARRGIVPRTHPAEIAHSGPIYWPVWEPDEAIPGREWATARDGSRIWVQDTGRAGEDRWAAGIEGTEYAGGASRDTAIRELSRTAAEDFDDPQNLLGLETVRTGPVVGLDEFGGASVPWQSPTMQFVMGGPKKQSMNQWIEFINNNRSIPQGEKDFLTSGYQWRSRNILEAPREGSPAFLLEDFDATPVTREQFADYITGRYNEITETHWPGGSGQASWQHSEQYTIPGEKLDYNVHQIQAPTAGTGPYPVAAHTGHFPGDNPILHMRTTTREGTQYRVLRDGEWVPAEGETAEVLEELQSDIHQGASHRVRKRDQPGYVDPDAQAELQTAIDDLEMDSRDVEEINEIMDMERSRHSAYVRDRTRAINIDRESEYPFDTYETKDTFPTPEDESGRYSIAPDYHGPAYTYFPQAGGGGVGGVAGAGSGGYVIRQIPDAGTTAWAVYPPEYAERALYAGGGEYQLGSSRKQAMLEYIRHDTDYIPDRLMDFRSSIDDLEDLPMDRWDEVLGDGEFEIIEEGFEAQLHLADGEFYTGAKFDGDIGIRHSQERAEQALRNVIFEGQPGSDLVEHDFETWLSGPESELLYSAPDAARTARLEELYQGDDWQRLEDLRSQLTGSTGLGGSLPSGDIPYQRSKEWGRLGFRKLVEQAVAAGRDRVVLITGGQAQDMFPGAPEGLQEWYDTVLGGRIAKAEARRLGLEPDDVRITTRFETPIQDTPFEAMMEALQHPAIINRIAEEFPVHRLAEMELDITGVQGYLTEVMQSDPYQGANWILNEIAPSSFKSHGASGALEQILRELPPHEAGYDFTQMADERIVTQLLDDLLDGEYNILSDWVEDPNPLFATDPERAKALLHDPGNERWRIEQVGESAAGDVNPSWRIPPEVADRIKREGIPLFSGAGLLGYGAYEASQRENEGRGGLLYGPPR